MKRNLGQSSLRRRKRSGNPMDAFDELPSPVRRWITQAALPWSVASVRRIWAKSRAKGLSAEEALLRLSNVEAKTLAQDRYFSVHNLNPRN
jgi:hypothetical protein